MTSAQALAFVRKHGVVLESARGPVPTLAEHAAGEPIRGSWWGHPKGHEIFALTRAVRASKAVLVCRVVDGKVTYVHRRLWSALVRLSAEFPRDNLAALREMHSPRGTHTLRTVRFPVWVPPTIRQQAARLTEAQARYALGKWTQKSLAPS
jgi:hypothetical protein